MLTPLLFVLGFVFIFVLGGLTGVMVAVVPFDWQVHDTYFLVAHFHYVLIGGAVFPMLAGVYYWLPKFCGRMPSERLGQVEFLADVHRLQRVVLSRCTFWGCLGMPRRVYTYPASLGLDGLNLLATIGAFVLAVGFLVFVFNVLYTIRYGHEAGDRIPGAATRWNGRSLRRRVSRCMHASQPFPAAIRYGSRRHARRPTIATGESVVEALDHRPEGWRATLLVDVITGRAAGDRAPGDAFVHAVRGGAGRRAASPSPRSPSCFC